MFPHVGGSRRKIAAVIGAGAAVGALGLISISILTTDAAPPRPNPEAASPNHSTATPSLPPGPGKEPERVLAEIQSRLTSAGVTSLRFVSVPSGRTAAPDARWIDITIDSDQGDGVEPNWVAALAQGAASDLLRTDQARTSDLVAGGQFHDRDTQGSPVTVELGSSPIAGGQDFRSPPEATLRARVRSVAEGFGLTVDSATVLHPIASALRVVLIVPRDTNPTWTIEDLRTALEGDPREIEGVYIELRSPQGEPLLMASTAYRTGAGGLWFAPGQDARFGANHGSAGETR